MNDDHEVLTSLIDLTSDLVILLDKHGKILRFNPVCERLTGYAESEVRGRTFKSLSQVLEAEEKFEEIRTEPRAPEDSLRQFESDLQPKHGDCFRVSWNEVTRRDASAEPRILLTGTVIEGAVRTDRLLATQYETMRFLTRVLLKNVPAEEAIRGCLETIATGLAADLAEYWAPQPPGEELRLLSSWNSNPGFEELIKADRDGCVSTARGLQARIWEGLASTDWVEEIKVDSSLTGDRLALSTGLRSRFGFPIVEANRVVGVMIFSTRKPATWDAAIRTSFTELGEMIGEHLARRRAKAELSRSEARKSAMLEASLDPIITMDHQGRIVEFNPAAERTFGYRRDSVIGRFLAEIIVPPDFREAHARGIQRYLSTGEGPTLNRRIELPALRANGDIFPSEVSIVPTVLDGIPIFTGYIRDITEKKKVEEEMRLAKEAAEAGSRAKSEFLANMSHELRTPMTAILGSADMLEEPDLTPEQSNEALKVIHRNGEHLLRVINNILDLSKLETENDNPEITEVAPWPLVAEVVSALNVQAREKNVELAARVVGKIPTSVRTDPIRVRPILFHLISNAIKFSEAGRIDVSMRFENSEDASGLRLHFEIEDQGRGMTSEQMALLFTPFYQADGSLTRASGGTGLGLLISRRLAQSLHGEILVESQLGCGSRFTLSIPVGATPGASLVEPGEVSTVMILPSEAGVDPKTSKLSGHVLVVDDSLDNQRVLNYHLSRHGLTIDIAENGRRAVELGTSRYYDLILMDIQMPELDGYSATRLLRRAGFTKPIVALTAHAMAGDEEKCLAAGCDAYLRKPVELDRLAKTLRRHLAPAKILNPVDGQSANLPPMDVAPLRSEFADDADFMQLVREYVDGLPAQVERLRDHLSHARLVEMSRLAHSLRGSGGMYGYDELSEKAGALEDMLDREPSATRIGEPLEDLDLIVKRICAGLA